MQSKLEIQLNEKDVNRAIREYVLKHENLEVEQIRISTGVKGDYDKGNAEDYVKKVYCKCKLAQ